MKSIKGFTVIELLLVVVIFGMIVSVAIPNLLYSIESAKLKNYFGFENLPHGVLHQDQATKDLLKSPIREKLVVLKSKCDDARDTEKIMADPKRGTEDITKRIRGYRLARTQADEFCRAFKDADEFATNHGLK